MRLFLIISNYHTIKFLFHCPNTDATHNYHRIKIKCYKVIFKSPQVKGENNMICPNCGNVVDDNAAICVHCGAATPKGIALGIGKTPEPPVDPNEPASKGMTALSFFIPMFGIIYGAIESGKGKKKAGKAYLIGAVLGMVFWVVVITIFTILMCALPFIILLLFGTTSQ